MKTQIMAYKRINGVESFSIATEVKIGNGVYQMSKDGTLIKVK